MVQSKNAVKRKSQAKTMNRPAKIAGVVVLVLFAVLVADSAVLIYRHHKNGTGQSLLTSVFGIGKSKSPAGKLDAAAIQDSKQSAQYLKANSVNEPQKQKDNEQRQMIIDF